MKVSSYTVARPAPIDRNPTTYNFGYALADGAPAAQTERLTYTIPAGKRAIIQSAFVSLIRVTVATVSARANANITVNVGAGNYSVIYCALRSNLVGERDTINITNAGQFVAATAIKLFTQDPCTGGTTDIFGGYTILEYDA